MTKKEFITELKNKLEPLEKELNIISFEEGYFHFGSADERKEFNVQICYKKVNESVDNLKIYRAKKVVGLNDDIDLTDILKECVSYCKKY